MGLTYKHSKRRTLSIQAGKVTTAQFFLKDKQGNKVLISNLEDLPNSVALSSVTTTPLQTMPPSLTTSWR